MVLKIFRAFLRPFDVQSLEVAYCPGRFLVFADLLSRNIQNAILRQDDLMSKSFSKIAIPLPHHLRNKVLKMNNDEFREYLMSNCKASLVDIQLPAYEYTQRYDSNHLPKLLRITTVENMLFNFLRDPWSNRGLYQLSLFTEFSGMNKILNKTSYEKILKQYKLKGLKEKLDQLGFSPNYFNSLKVNFDKKEREMAESNLKKLNSKKKCINQIMHEHH